MRRMASLGITCCLVAAASWMQVGKARAGDQVQETIVPSSLPLSGAFQLTKHGKIKIKPSTKAGDGGITLQLTLSGVDCPPNNDTTPGTCGKAGIPQTNHVMDISSALGALETPHVAGVKYKLEQGKATFQATGTNKIGGAAFGAVVSAIFNNPLGFGYIEFKTPGTRPSDCDSTPLPGGACGGAGTNCCTNGTLYGYGGIVAGCDDGVTCSVDTDCALTQKCVMAVGCPGSAMALRCVTQACDQDSDCRSVQCGSGCTCCDPSIDPTCAAQCTNTPNCNSCPSVP